MQGSVKHMHNDLTFFTNEPERNLYERFNKILNSNTQFFDILVGYFRTSGFFRMYEAMESVEKIRVLVGLNVDRKTMEIINKAEDGNIVEVLSHKEAKDAFTGKVESEFATSEDSYNVEKGVRYFIDWLRTGKMEMRMYVEAPIHAKVYIMRKDMEKVPDTYGTVITGSSNFSDAGLKNNLEFNVELKDSRDVEFALDEFEKLWKQGVDIKDTYVDAVEEKTWLRSDISPYEMYLKTLYEFFKEEINADKDMLIDDLLPDGYMRLQYQIDAVMQAKKILESYNGVFISDVVGLGKTYICAMLAKSLKGGRKLIICPPVLVEYWEEVLREFDVPATVQSLGKLDKIIEKGVDGYAYVFIDEAHRFRNQDTEGFKLLHQICYNKKVVLISATPINNYSSDIENQIYLFQPKHNSTIIPNQKNIEGFFARLNGKLKKLEKGTPVYHAQLRENSEEIRDKVLRHIMIRRVRKEIEEYYKDDLEKQGLSFPKLGTPEKVVYTFNEATDEVFKETMYVIKELKYARYTPLLYLKDNKKYSTMLVSQRNMSGFMKSILVKRLESSFFAFKMTLGRFIDSYELFIEMCKNGEVYISKKVNVYDMLDNGDDEKLMKLVDDERVQHFNMDEFKSTFLPALAYDLSMLKDLKEHWDKIDEDPKLDEFRRELKNNNILKKNKLIIFTESKETAKYLGSELQKDYGDSVVVFSGDGSNYLKAEIEKSFNPKSKEHNDKYRILITTDVLAEGINLHRSNVLINYDLPWNPTRIMQRVGRINRVGTEFDRIYVFNFFPTAETNKQLPLKERIAEKLQAFHDTLGEDFKYLSDDEEVSSHRLYEELTGDLDEDEEGSNPELAYLAIIRELRDNDTDLFYKIRRIPIKSKTGKYSKKVQDDTTVTFLRRGALKQFFITGGSETRQINFMEAISYLKSEVREDKLSVGEHYYNQLDSNKKAFDDVLGFEEDIAIAKASVTGNDAKMIKNLKGISKCKMLTDEQEENIKKMIILWENGDIAQSLTKEIMKDIKEIDDPVQAYFEIFDRVPDRYFEKRRTKSGNANTEKQVILSLFMKSGGNI
jgi:superfamily II DNA/RNA helicase